MPNFYEYAGQKYSITFPIHWAADHKEGTGPLECDTCKQYGCEDGIFKNYCLRCLTNDYPDMERFNSSFSYTNNNINVSISNDDDETDISVISEYTDDIEDGIGCNRCYSCVTGGAGPCVLNLESSIGSDDEADNIDGVETELDSSNMLSNSFNSSIYRNPNSSSLQTIDVSCTFEDEYLEEKDRSSVAPLFIAPSSVSNDIAEEINRYIQENPIDEPDDIYEYGIMNGYESGYNNNFDIASGYCSY